MGVAVVTAVLATMTVVTSTSVAHADSRSAPEEQPDVRSATAAARQFGKRVVIANLTTPTRQVYANPNGSHTLEAHAVPVRARQGDRWVPVDLTVRPGTDGTVGPGATTVPVRFSGGGATAPLVELGAAQKFALRWPGSLPAPRLEGADATYVDVLPGVDLRMTATADGYRQALVVKTREAAANLTRIRLDTVDTGLVVRVADGRLSAADRGGKVVFTSAKPQMWDAGNVENGEQRRASVGLSLAGGRLDLLPDRGLLTDPGVRFPVEIDPDMSPGRVGWTSVFAEFPDREYWNGANLEKDPLARAGFSGSWEPKRVTVRSFFKFDVTELFDTEIIEAEFNILEKWAPSCGAREVALNETGTVDESTTWARQPWIGQQLGVQNVAYGHGNDCPPGNVGFDARGAVVNSVNVKDKRDDVTVMLSADEHDMYAWKKFDPTTATLNVTYNREPDAPEELLSQQDKPCARVPNEPVIGTATPALRATLSDPDDDSVEANFEWYRQNVKVGSVRTPFQPSGTRFSARVPEGAYADGQTVKWRVRAGDNRVWGPWSDWCEVTIDNTRPDRIPTVHSDMYPEHDLGGSIGATGKFRLDANGVADVAGFYYDLQDGASRYIPADRLGGGADAYVTPPDFGPQTLWVYSADRAGNRSVEPARYEFFVGRGWGTTGQWRMEGKWLDRTVHDGSGNNHDGVIGPSGTQWTVGRVGNALQFDGTSGYVDAGPQATVDTVGSYSVSAWVKLDQANGYRTVVSQNANVVSGFYLSYAEDVNTWIFSTPPEDVDGPDRNRVVARTPAVTGTWTHLLATQDAGTGEIKLYVNGVLQGSAEHNTRIAAVGGLQLGRAKHPGGYTDFFAGAVDEVKTFNRVLNAEEAGVLAGSPAVEEGRWLMDEGAGTIAFDVSDRARNLSLNTNAAWTTGYAGEGHALRFNGTDTTATTNQPAFRTDSSYTVSANVKVDTVDATSHVAIGQDGKNNSGFTIGYDGTSKAWQFSYPIKDSAAATVVKVTAPEPLRLGEWAHLTAVRDTAAGQIRLYVNGVRVGMTPATGTPWNAAGSLRLGGQAGNRWLGDIDNVRVYAGIRTDDQIRDESADPVLRAPDVFAGQLNRWINHRNDHWMSRSGAPAGYMFAGSYGLPAPEGAPDTVALSSCRIGGWDEFTSVRDDCEGNEVIARLGPVYRTPPAGVPTLPLYRCVEPGNNNQHFNSNDPNCEGQRVDGLLGYTRAYGNLIRSVQPESPGDHWVSAGDMRVGNRPEGNLGLVALTGLPGTVGLFTCQDGADEFLWTDDKCDGKTLRGWTGAIWTAPPAGVAQSAAIYNCRDKVTGERFVSNSVRCEGNGTGVRLGYVVTQL